MSCAGPPHLTGGLAGREAQQASRLELQRAEELVNRSSCHPIWSPGWGRAARLRSLSTRGDHCTATVSRVPGYRATTDTVDDVPVTQKRPLSIAKRIELEAAIAELGEAQERVRELTLAALEEASFRDVAEVTGFSTASLQKWKREAQ